MQITIIFNMYSCSDNSYQIKQSTQTNLTSLMNQKIEQNRYKQQQNPQQLKIRIPKLHKKIQLAYNDLNALDPIGKNRYFIQVVTFIFQHLQRSMGQGLTLYESEQLIMRELKIAVLKYTLGPVQPLHCKIQSFKKFKEMPDLCSDIHNLTKQSFTDRIKEISLKSKEVSYEFNKQMQVILQKNGGYKFKGNYKATGVKAYLRILTKIMNQFVDENQGSKQVYHNLDHYYWNPTFVLFNRLIDENINKIKIQMYDWVRCKVCYKTIEQLQAAYDRLMKFYGNAIFRVKNRICSHTRDVLININYYGYYGEIQLCLPFSTSAYDFMHKLYELTREKLGIAYSCFMQLLNQTPTQLASVEGVMTSRGYIKRMLIREQIQPGFQRCRREDVQNEWINVEELIGQWEIVALQTGVIRGKGYGQLKYRISNDLYGPDINQMLIIKRKVINDPLVTWLNWMDQEQMPQNERIANSII